jgi:hypothetical protein
MATLWAALFGGSGAALAATCGIIGSATAQTAVYDPFAPTPFAATTVTLSILRVDPPGANGGKTAVVNFYLKARDASANGTSIVPTSVVTAGTFAGTGLNIFYDFTASPPTLQPTSTTNPSGANRFLKIEFTGNNAASNPAVVTFSVNLPANLNLASSADLPFDAYYSCTTTGGGAPTDQVGQLNNAVVFPIKVLSALQASFVGTALDFQEIGTETTGGKTTGTSQYVRVQSSGAYTVALQSQNAFRLRHPSGSLANSVETVKYKLKAFGQFYSFATNPSPGAVAFTKQCARAGIGTGNEDRVYLQGVLEEGGAGKTPSLGGNYSDTLTVTVTPQDIGTTYSADCNADGAL